MTGPQIRIPPDGEEDTCWCGEGIHYATEFADWQHDDLVDCEDPYPAAWDDEGPFDTRSEANGER